MKKFITVLLCIATSAAFCQQDSATKILLIVKADCRCFFQLAVNNKPAGQIFIITADSVQFKVKKEETGFFIHCGESNIVYIRIANRPGNGYLRFAGKMECDKKNIEPFKPDEDVFD